MTRGRIAVAIVVFAGGLLVALLDPRIGRLRAEKGGAGSPGADRIAVVVELAPAVDPGGELPHGSAPPPALDER